MRTLTAAAERFRTRADAQPLLLLKIEFTSPSAQTLRLSDRAVTAIGEDWQPLVAAWGPLTQEIDDLDTGGRPGSFEVSLYNNVKVELGGTSTRARLSDTVHTVDNATTGAFEWAFAKATLSLLMDESLASGDEVTLGVFYLEDPEDLGEDIMRVRMSDFSLLLEDRMRATIVSAADFPNADPDVIGKAIPFVLGDVPDVPGRAVVAGKMTKLAADLANPAAGGVIEVTSTSGFTLPLTVQIDSEQIVVSAIAAESDGVSGRLTVSNRGANGTTAGAHAGGTTVLEVRSSYIFVLGQNQGDFKTKSLNNVKINGRLLTENVTTSVDNTSLVAGKSFATVTFTVPPTQIRAVHAFANGGGTFSATNVPAYLTRRNFTGGGEIIVGLTTPIVASNVTLSSGVRRRVTGRLTRTDQSITSVSLGSSMGVGLGTIIGATGYVVPQSFVVEYVTGLNAGRDALTFVFNFQGDNNVDIWIDSYTMTIETETLGGNTTVEMILGQVTADVEGIKDNAAGTISGTANLLLEIPSDQAKFILTQLYSGVAAADLGTTWTATRSNLSAAGYKWAWLLEPPLRFSEFRQRIGKQARSLVYVDSGLVEMKYMADSPTADLTLNYDRDVRRDQPARVSRTPRTLVKNSLTAYSNRDWARNGLPEDIYERATLHEDLSIGGFGDALKDTLELSHVLAAATASSLGTFWLNRLSRQQFVAPFAAWFNLAGVQLGDQIAFEEHPILDTFGGPSRIFRVVGVNRPGGSDPHRIDVRAVQIDRTITYALVAAVTLLPQAAALPASGAPALNDRIGTNQVGYTLDFDKDSEESAYWALVVPRGVDLSSAAVDIVSRQASVTAGTLAWRLLVTSLADGDAWDTAGALAAVSGAIEDVAGKINVLSVSLPLTGWAAGELLRLRLIRDVNNDTVTEDTGLVAAVVRFLR